MIQTNTQNLPCTLYQEWTEFEDGSDESEWICEVFGADAMNLGSANRYTQVKVVGMEYVLAQNPNIQSGHTTLLAEGATLENHKLTIGIGNSLTFGENTQEIQDRRRKLSAFTGDLSVLVVRVTTADGALTKQRAEISGDVFGTPGTADSINLKSLVEDCSNSVATINPGVGTGSACVDAADAIFNVPLGGGYTYNCDFFNDYRVSTRGDLCIYFGNRPQLSPTYDRKARIRRARAYV